MFGNTRIDCRPGTGTSLGGIARYTFILMTMTRPLKKSASSAGNLNGSKRGINRTLLITVALLTVALLSQVVSPRNVSAFEWLGKIELDAQDLQSDDPQKRLAAVQRLATYGDSVALIKPHLMAALSDPDIKVRQFAGRVLGQFGVVEIIPTITRWLNSAEVSLRVSATDILGELGQRDSGKALIRTLADSEADVRLHAIFALGKLATEEAVVPLIARLSDNKANVRRAAIAELAALGDPRALIPLVGAMSDPSVEARLAAIRAVGKLGDQSAVPALMRLLNDSSEPIKVAAIASLGNLGASQATNRLIVALATGSDDSRARAAFALGQIATTEATQNSQPRNKSTNNQNHSSKQSNQPTPTQTRAINALVAALASPRTRPAAREALLAAGAAATQGLIDHLRGEGRGHPATVVRLLRDIGDPRATPTLLSELNRQRIDRELIIEAIASAGDQRALVPVLTLLSEPDPRLRLAAMKALKPMLSPGQGAEDVLVDLLDDPIPEIQLLAAHYLERLAASSATQHLLKLAKKTPGKPILRRAALSALGAIGDPSIAPQLLELLVSGPISIRREAGNTLTRIHSQAVVPQLLSSIEDQAPDRPLLISILGGILRGETNPRANALLSKLALNSRRTEAVAAMNALGAIGSTKASDALLTLLGSASVDRRRAAATNLGHLQNPAAASKLSSCLLDDDDGVAAACALALGKLGNASLSWDKIISALENTLKRRGFSTAINASAALAMIAAVHPAIVSQKISNWQALLHHSQRLVRANGVLAAGHSNVTAQRKEIEYLLAKDPSWLVRLNAARVLSQWGNSQLLLRRAANHDGSKPVRTAAVALQKHPFTPPSRTTWITLVIVDPTSNDRTIAQEPYFLVGADGIVTSAYSDVLGQITDEQFPPDPHIHAPMGSQREY